MTERMLVLRPTEPVQRLASPDKETPETLQDAVGECTPLIIVKGAAASRQQELLQTCVDTCDRVAAQSDTLERVAVSLELHDRQLLAMARALEAPGTAIVAWRDQTHGEGARQAHLGQAQVLGELVRNTTSLAARFAHFEAVLARHNPGFRALVGIALLFGIGYGAGLMTDIMVTFIDRSAGMSVPPVTELLSWLSLGAGPEAAAPE